MCLRGTPSGGSPSEALWDASTWKPIHVWPNAVWSATAINQAESFLASVTGHGEIAVWNLHTGSTVEAVRRRYLRRQIWRGAPSTLFSHVDFSPDGTRLIDAGGGACATIWNWQQVTLRNRCFPAAAQPSTALRSTRMEAGPCWPATMARLWCGTSRPEPFRSRSRKRRQRPALAVSMAFFTPDGKEVVTGGFFEEAAFGMRPVAVWCAYSSLISTRSFPATLFPLPWAASAIAPSRSAATAGARYGILRRRNKSQAPHIDDDAGIRSLSFSADGRNLWRPAPAARRMSLTPSGEHCKRKLGKSGNAASRSRDLPARRQGAHCRRQRPHHGVEFD